MLAPAFRRRRSSSASRPKRRGVVMLECGLVYSATLTLVLGTMILGLGVFQYQQLAALAREGSRWASVHGPTYVSEQSQPAITKSDVMTNAILPHSSVINTAALTCSLTMTNGQAIVTLNYTWTPEGYWSPVVMKSTSNTPIQY